MTKQFRQYGKDCAGERRVARAGKSTRIESDRVEPCLRDFEKTMSK